jgi:hypothetical protein
MRRFRNYGNISGVLGIADIFQEFQELMSDNYHNKCLIKLFIFKMFFLPTLKRDAIFVDNRSKFLMDQKLSTVSGLNFGNELLQGSFIKMKKLCFPKRN